MSVRRSSSRGWWKSKYRAWELGIPLRVKKEMNNLMNFLNNNEIMPVIFVGHGTPMNAMEENRFSRNWRAAGEILPRPSAVLCISAHWETQGTLVTAMAKPRTIHDFGGFPPELYEVQYPAPGSLELAREIKDTLQSIPVGLDTTWGLDHGCWSVLRHMYPAADIPVVQLSLDYSRSAPAHYALAKELASLRRKGVLILGSGNMVHNLGRIVIRSDGPDDFNQPFALDWATQADELFKKLINEDRHRELSDYKALGDAVQLAVPTPEHFLPLLYTLALKQENETVHYFNDQPVAGSLTMTSLIINDAGKNAEYAKQIGE
jgi:4,5-DOPA dioxygenase extradiol